MACAPALEGKLGSVVGNGQPQGYAAGVHHAVGQIFYVFGAEVVVAAVAQRVGDARACHAQRVGAVALRAAQVGVACGHGVDEVVEVAGVGEQLHGVDGVGLARGHGVAYGRFLGILGMYELVGSMAAKIAVVVEKIVEHVHAHLRANVADEHRLLHEPVV